MNQYKLIAKKGEGTFSEVFKAQSLKTGSFVAIKCMKSHFNNIEQVQRLREIQALKKVSTHVHIIKLIEVLFDEPTGRLALVFELMDLNLYETIRGRKTYLNQQKVKYIMYQLMKAIDHIHKRGIFHRDIKPENILLVGDQVKLADFGSCKGMFSEHPYTEYISTRWYRAPECLLTDGHYDFKMDIWGAGCIMFEIISLFPLFPGDNELDQVHKIHKILGTPDQEILDRFQEKATHMEFNFQQEQGTGIAGMLPFASKEALDLMEKLLIYDPKLRITSQEALQHPYFKDIYDLENSSSHLQQKALGRTTNLSHSLSPQKYQSPTHKDPNNLTLRGAATLGVGNGLNQGKYKQGYNQSQYNQQQQHNQGYQNPGHSNHTSTFGGNSNGTLNKFHQTQKYKSYKEQQQSGENVFYPVLSMKKAKKKKKNMFTNTNVGMGNYTQYNDLQIMGNKDSGTEDEGGAQYNGLLPPIKYQQSLASFSEHNNFNNSSSQNINLGASLSNNNMNNYNKIGNSTAKHRDNSNPFFKVSKKKHKESHFSSTNNVIGDYLILGKKANYK